MATIDREAVAYAEAREDALEENIDRCAKAIEAAGDSTAARAIHTADIDRTIVVLLEDLGATGDVHRDTLRNAYDEAIDLMCDLYA